MDKRSCRAEWLTVPKVDEVRLADNPMKKMTKELINYSILEVLYCAYKTILMQLCMYQSKSGSAEQAVLDIKWSLPITRSDLALS